MTSAETQQSRSRWFALSLARGLAAFFALYSLVALIGAVFMGAYNQNAWWLDLSPLPWPLSALLQMLLTLVMGVFAVYPPRQLALRLCMALVMAACFVVALINCAEVYLLAARGVVVLGFPVPFSLFVALALAFIAAMMLRASGAYRPHKSGGVAKRILAAAAAFLLAVLLFPLGQMHCFGTTDYRVRVDAAVVLGAQVYPNGTPSPVLQDRLDTAIAFYESGYTSLLVMSGGIDADGVSEARAMQDYAVEHGVRAADIVLDEQGDNTRATARNTVAMLQERGIHRVAAVSNFYHLARIKLLYLSQGLDVVTVPSVPVKDGAYPLPNVLREIPGWWYYWFTNLVE